MTRRQVSRTAAASVVLFRRRPDGIPLRRPHRIDLLGKRWVGLDDGLPSPSCTHTGKVSPSNTLG
jgi:hypothetical protein